LIRDISVSGAATLTVLLFTAIGGMVSARYLLLVGKGELTAIILWPTLLVNLGGLGLAEAVTFQCAITPPLSRQILSTAISLVLATSALLVPAGYLLLPSVLAHYGQATVATARMFLFFVPVSLVSVLMLAAMQGNMQLGPYNVLRTLVQILTVLGTLGIIVAGMVTVRGVALATLAANLVTLAAASELVWRRGWIGLPDWGVTGRQLLRFGLRAQLGSLASLLNLRLDQMLMSMLMSASLLGIYIVGTTVAGLAVLAPAVIVIVAAPKISGQPDLDGKLQAWGRLLRISILLQLVVAAVLWILTPLAISLGFGPSFEMSAPVTRILIVASLPLGINMLLSAGFRAFNDPLTPSKAELISLVATVAGLWLLLRRLGPEGAAYASLAAYSITCAFLFGRTRARLRISVRDLLVPSRQDFRDARALLPRRAPESV
jgi:O-antigen/teichoic acid export membrane protein